MLTFWLICTVMSLLLLRWDGPMYWRSIVVCIVAAPLVALVALIVLGYKTYYAFKYYQRVGAIYDRKRRHRLAKKRN